MAERSQLYLIRHGETAWSLGGQHTGRTDIDLTDRGRRQARALAGLLEGRRFARVMTSPLRRARETAELAGLGAGAEVLDDLREWDYGDYEGATTRDIRERVPGWLIWTSPVPNGETLEQVGARAERILERARALDGDVALFAHGHILRILIARWCGLAPIEGRRFALGTATLSVLGWEHDYPTLCAFNVAP
jgi:broad specificity phosphatase PhoE